MKLNEQEFLQKINDLVEAKLGVNELNHFLDYPQKVLLSASAHLCVSSMAKRARPLICLYAKSLFDESYEQSLLNVAVAAEFIHAASLMHDDIVDKAERRRGKSSINHVYGNNIAVLAGDFLLSEAFELIKGLDRMFTDRAIEVVREMTKAAMRELLTRGNTLLSEPEWRGIAIGKTSSLFSWCTLSANLGANKVDVARLWRAGTHIGLIFQMADDLKDFSGDHDLKDVCRDIRNKEPSLPIILAAAQNAHIKEVFIKYFALETISLEIALELKDLVLNSGAIKESKKLMAKEIDTLQDLLSPYEGSLGKQRIDKWMEDLSSSVLY